MTYDNKSYRVVAPATQSLYKRDTMQYHVIPFNTMPGLHKLWYPVVRDRSTWSKFGAHGERGDVFGELCSGLALGEP